MGVVSFIFGDRRVLLFVVLVIAVFLWNGISRVQWQLRWNAAGNRSLPIPEKRWTYDARDVEEFAGAADRAGMLDSYRSAILHRSDLCFAIALAAITAFVWYQIAVTPTDFQILNWAALPLGAMAILYGVADVAEDLKLAAILSHPQSIDAAEVAATNMLTRIKMVTLTLSVVGGVIFGIIWSLETWAVRRRSPPIPA
jgi:hypothetical protein